MRKFPARGLLIALLAAATAFAQGPDDPLTGRISLVTSDDRIDIDIGDSALKGGDVGLIMRDGAQVGVASVIWVDLGHTRLRVLSIVPGQAVKVGDSVVFPDRKIRRNSEAGDASVPSAGPASVSKGDDFVPLLAPVAVQKTAISNSQTIFHGRLRVAEVYQTVMPSKAFYSSSRMDSDGSIERMAGGAWSLDWAGNASRRDGSVPSTADDYRKISPHLYRGTLTRKWQSSALLRLGRFYPAELSGIGYVDGAQADAPVVSGLRLGAVAGARPDRTNMGFSGLENVGSAYASVEAGELRKLYYTGTVGMMRTLYKGKGDELAALWDQRADLGPKLNLFSTMQFDFPTGSAVEHTGTRLTRLNLNLNSPTTEHVSLRAGASHFEPFDTAVDRALAGGTTFYLNNGYWRYWGGTSQMLPAGFHLDEDLSFTNTSNVWLPGQWRFAVGRRGMLGIPDASMTAAVYSLYNPAGPDYGGSLTAGLPLGAKFNVDGSAGARLGPTSVARRHFWVSDASIHANWRPSKAWSLDAIASRSWQESVHSTVVNGGISWRW